VAAANFAQALALVLVHEGGKSDDPHDPGGRTNWGITHIDYDAYRKSKGLPLQDVYLMTTTERDEIYRTQYWDPIRGDDLPPGLDYVVFDGGVNSGISQSVKWLQRSVPTLPANGRMAQAIVSAASQVTDLTTLIETCCEARREFLQSLSTFQYFGNGWMTRVNDVQTTALAWASGAAPAPAASPSPTSQPKALRESAAPLPSTALGDVTAAASAVGIAATIITHSTVPPSAPASPAVASSTTTSPATAPPSVIAPAPTPAGPVTSTAPAAPVATAPVASTSPAPVAPGSTIPPTTVPTTLPAAAPSAPASIAPSGPLPPTATAQVNVPSKPAPTPVTPPTKPLPQVPATAPGTPAPASAIAAAPTKPAPVIAAPSTAPTPTPALHPNLGPSLLSPPSKTAGAQSQIPMTPGAPPTATETQPGIVATPPTPTLFFGIPDSFFPGVLGVLVVTFLFGLYKTFSSRSSRARISDALGDNPIPTTALKIGKLLLPVPTARTASSAAVAATPAPAVSEAGVPLVRSFTARALSVLWIGVTIVVNVIALAELLQGFGFAHENWHQPLVWLSNQYNSYAGQAFNATSASVSQQFGIKLPPWLLPAFVLYVSSASAFVVASTGLMKRNTSGEAFFAAVVHAGWIFAVPAFVMDAVRYHVVTRFARQNTVLFFGYLASFLVVYMAARFINDDILPGFMQHYGAAAGSMITNGAAAASAISNAVGGH